MSRSGYSNDGYDQWQLIMWRGQVASAIKGKRGQAFLMELLDALEAMPEKRLISKALRQDGNVCALGAVGARRGVDLEALDPDDYEAVAGVFGIARQMVQEIEYENDEAGDWYGKRTPEQRWQHMYDWAMRNLRPVPAASKRRK
jgi:hypothetical protein